MSRPADDAARKKRAPVVDTMARPGPVDAIVAARAWGQFVAEVLDRPPAPGANVKPWYARGPPSVLELERILTLAQVAALTGISADGLRRHYRHLIRRLSPRRVGIKMRDVLTIGAPEEAATDSQ